MSKLAIFGGEPSRKTPYPKWPELDDRDIDALVSTLKSGRWGGFPYPGPNTAAFSEKFAEIQGGGFAVPMVNGTVTMEIATRALGIGWGDEVIVPALTFQATATAPMTAGAVPVFVDVDPDNLCLDPEKVKPAITDKTKAIFVVHLGAQMADMDAIMEIAKENGLEVIEDSAHAHGARWNNKGAGTFGKYGSFSMQSSKILTTGEGGILLCQTRELAEWAASLIDCGRPKDKDGKNFTLGTNYRISELQTTLGLIALERFPEQMATRESILGYLEERLSEVPGIRLLKHDPRHTRRSFYRYIINIDPEFFECEHMEFCYALNKEGIPCWEGYPPMNRYDLFQPQLSKMPVPSAFQEYFNFEEQSFPVAERAGEREAVYLDEKIFRSGKEGIDDVVSALIKLGQSQTELSKLAEQRQAMLDKREVMD